MTTRAWRRMAALPAGAVGAGVGRLRDRGVRLSAQVGGWTRGEQAAIADLRASEAWFRALAEQASDLVCVVDAARIIRYASPSYQRLLGYAPAALVGRDAYALIHPDDRPAVQAHFARYSCREDADGNAGPAVPMTCRVRHADGSWRTMEALGTDRRHDPAIAGIIVTSRDVTERRHLEELERRRACHIALRADVSIALAAQTTLQEMLQCCCDAMVRHLDASFTRIWTRQGNAGALELQGSAGPAEGSGAAATPPDAACAELIVREQRPFWTNDVASHARLDGAGWARSQGFVTYAGYPLLTEGRSSGALALFSRTPLADDTLAVLTVVAEAIAQGIERKRVEEAIRAQATHDALTGLPNRILLYDRLEEALRGGVPLALLLLDLDRFKDVNDTMGHHCGDLLLQQLAARLQETVRASDTVARLGGDEFSVLLHGADATDATAVTTALLAALERPIVLEGQALMVGTSIGVALSPAHGSDVETLLRQADIAMYAAKRDGLGYALYDPVRDAQDAASLALVSDLRRAIANDGLVLHYQPKIDTASGRVAGVEALARWSHPQHGLIPPDRFIPLAEQTGLITPLTRWVLEAALRQCRDWEGAGLVVEVAVNLSLRNLRDPQLVETVAALLDQYGVPPQRLCLELTESVVMADVEGTQETLRRLSGLGVHLSIDDFGTGYSSLAYLSRLPVHELKIDRSFVRGMASHAPDATIVACTIGLGHSLGLSVVTEGVEDVATWQLLRHLGSDAAQGYYLGRPLPASEVEPWLRQVIGDGDRASA